MKRLIIILVILVSGLVGLGIYSYNLNNIEPVKTEDVTYLLNEELCNALVEHFTSRYHLYHTTLIKDSTTYEYLTDCYITNYMFTTALVIDEDKENNCIQVKHTFIADKYDLITKQTYRKHPFTDTLTIRFEKKKKKQFWILSDWN